MKLTKKSWVKLPLILKQLPGITRATADVGACIFHQCQNDPQKINLKEIAELLGLNEKTVRRSVSALVAADLIAVQPERGKPSVYQITDKCRELCASALVASRKQQYKDVAAIDPEMAEYMSLSNHFID